MQKIAILSDIHGNMAALEKVIDDLQTRGVDCVFNLGDHVSGPLWPKETIQFLMTQDWMQILGNHDRQLIDQNPRQHGASDSYAFQQLNAAELDWIRTLPASMEIRDEFLLIHGTPSSDTTYLLETVERGRARPSMQAEIVDRLGETKSRIIFCGHTHIPRIVEVPENTLIVNPGSVGLPAYEDELPEYHVMETGSPHARYAILEYVNGDWLVEKVAIPYEHRKAAAQAHKNGRFDWEIGIRTGFMQERKPG
jgi:putative phosphoesterase